MRQKIITSMLHVVSNPHSDLCDCLATKLFDVTISDLSNNKSYPTFFCEYHSHVQHYLSTFRTLNSLMFVAYKKFFLCCNKHVAQFFMLTKIFVDIFFFKKFFHSYNIHPVQNTLYFPSRREIKGNFSPTDIIYDISKYFEINYILQKCFV